MPKTRLGIRRVLTAISLFTFIAAAWQFLPASLRNSIMPVAYAATFTVNTTVDHDDGTCDAADCSLREAINAVNAGAGGDTISFNIAGSGVRTINLASALPIINKAVTINGTTQPGFAGTPRIELNGSGAGGANGLVFNTGSVTVRSLIINRFGGYGIDLEGTALALITGCYIGVDANGTSAAANGSGGIKANAGDAFIGVSTDPGNVISGNTGNGIDVLKGSISIQKNFIGTNAAGSAAIANTAAGVKVTTGQAIIGGSNANVRNIISGNGAEGVLINGSSLVSLIQGNYIGTDVNGNSRIGNGAGGGIHIVGSNGHAIGGANPGEGNVLSGNIGGTGFGIEEDNSNNITIQGNIIGLNAAGTAAIQNDPGGIILFGGANHTVGGTTAGARNVVSGNGGAGILILADSCTVRGNYFGTNAAGTAAIGNGASGILINGGDNNTIGGTTAAARNVIAGNGNGGVRIAFSADGNTVQGNFIGTDVNGTTGLGNGVGFAGVVVFGSSINDSVGGTAAGAGNLIAFNQGPGVWVPDGTKNPILGNSIFSNAGLGIDLGGNVNNPPNGVTANDACDADTGGNNLQNFPVITSVTVGASNTTIVGTLNSTASTQFRLEFFANQSCNAAGSGEGKTFITSTNVTTDGSCAASFNVVVPNASITGPMITATATDPNNNTSEFSACAFAPLTNTIQFNASTLSVGEGTASTTLTVNRFGDTTAAATVQYTTGDSAGSQACNVFNGNASSRCDYLITLGTLQFAANETSKTITLSFFDDTYKEGDETFFVKLSNATGATVGAPDTLTITITDNDGATGPNNPSDQTAFFVRAHYLDFLNREPDNAGFPFWTGNIDNCTPKPSCTQVQRINTSAAFFLSIEFQQTGYLVERFYKVAYGDGSGSSTLNGAHTLAVPKVRFIEFLTDTQRVQRGVVVNQGNWQQQLETNKQAYAGEFVQTTRFITAFPTTMTPTQFVDKLFDNAGLAKSGNDYTTSINFFGGAGNTTNTTARAQAVRQVAENTTLFNAEFNRAFVLAQYFGYLRRNPDDPQDSDYTGFDFWLTKLNQFNGDYLGSEMVKAFMTSSEYRQRFGP